MLLFVPLLMPRSKKSWPLFVIALPKVWNLPELCVYVPPLNTAVPEPAVCVSVPEVDVKVPPDRAKLLQSID